MSIAVNNYPQVAYSGVAGTPARAVKMFDAPGMKPAAAVLEFNWTVYFAAATAKYGSTQSNVAVPVDFSGGSSAQGGPLDKIVTCKIDNSNSYNSILVHFPDTGDTLACAPQTIVTLTACTNSNKCYVIAQGLASGFLPLTTITFYNYFVPPSVDPLLQLVYPQELGSPSIQRQGGLSTILTPGYGPRALGDQFVNQNFSLGGSPGTPLLPAVAAGGFYTLTHFFGTVASNTGANDFASIEIRTGVAMTDVVFRMRGRIAAFPTVQLLSLQGMNLKFSALFRIEAFVSTGTANQSAELNLAYTYNPDR
jgi:hypothetical protein